MSGYTIGEIVVWLLLTAVLGFALGWMCRELLVRARTGAAAAASEPRPEPAPEPEPRPEPAPEPQPDAPVIMPGPHPGSALPAVGGGAPTPAHVVKVSRGSKIYHEPSSPAYARTTAALWFTSAQAAEDAGFRKPKNA